MAGPESRHPSGLILGALVGTGLLTASQTTVLGGVPTFINRRITMYRTMMVGILGVSLMVLTACESMTGKTTGQTIDDATVTASVQGKLMNDKLSNFSRINVDTDRSVVTLNGVVRSVAEKSRAEELALQVAGVRTVNNNLQIQSPSLSNP